MNLLLYMNFEKFTFRNTIIRLFAIMILLAITQIDNISNIEDFFATVGGIIVGSVASEIALRFVYYMVFLNIRK